MKRILVSLAIALTLLVNVSVPLSAQVVENAEVSPLSNIDPGHPGL
ncbi:hypothetical protein ACS127_00605 [Amphibacillus sp. Q70]